MPKMCWVGLGWKVSRQMALLASNYPSVKFPRENGFIYYCIILEC